MSDAVGEVIPVAARPKAWVFGRLPAGIVASNPARRNDFLCCQCCMSNCDRDAATSRSPGPPEAVASTDAAITDFDVMCTVWVLNFAPPLSLSLSLRCLSSRQHTGVSLGLYSSPYSHQIVRYNYAITVLTTTTACVSLRCSWMVAVGTTVAHWDSRKPTETHCDPLIK